MCPAAEISIQYQYFELRVHVTINQNLVCLLLGIRGNPGTRLEKSQLEVHQKWIIPADYPAFHPVHYTVDYTADTFRFTTSPLQNISCKMLAGEAISPRRWTTKRSSKFYEKNNDFRSWKSDASPLNEELETEVPCWSTMTEEAWKGPPESVERMILKVSKIILETTSGAMRGKNAWRS